MLPPVGSVWRNLHDVYRVVDHATSSDDGRGYVVYQLNDKIGASRWIASVDGWYERFKPMTKEMWSYTFTGPNIEVKGYINDGVLYIGHCVRGRIERGVVLEAPGCRPHRVVYSVKPPPGFVACYRVAEVR